MRDLRRLLHPRHVAIVGGGRWGEGVITACRKIGFAGHIWPVHPARDELAGVPAFQSIDDLPKAPDAAYVAVNRQATIDVVAALARSGAGGAVCFASGFLEARNNLAESAALQSDLLAAAGDMPIIGPNCYGFLNYLDATALWPDQHGGKRVESGVAIVTQSSNIAINLTMQRRGLPLAYLVTAGNQAQTGLADIAIALLEDPRVTALGLHIEGIGDLRRFEAMARTARQLGKPIVALKVGASDQARVATVSHTASLAGSEAGAAALMERLGIGQVRSLATLIETLKVLHVAGPLPSLRVASMSCSGGEASLMADCGAAAGLSFPQLTPLQTCALRRVLGPRIALANPLDYHTDIWGDVPAMTTTFTTAMQGDVACGVIVLDVPRSDRCDGTAWEPVIAAATSAQKTTGRPLAILASLSETMPEVWAERLMARGLVPLSGMTEGLEALAVAARTGKAGRPDPVLQPPPGPPGATLGEAEAKAVLARYGLRVPKSLVVNDGQKVVAAAQAVGFPVVLKAQGLDHKTEAGGVALNLMTAREVTEAAAVMPSGPLFVEAMVPGAVAELLIGIVRDPAHGHVLTVAAGGTLTELMHDRASALVPITREAADDLLSRLKICPLLDGYRGGPGADRAAILDAILAIQSYTMQAHPYEVEVNPLICTPHGAIAVDALIRTGDRDE